MAPSRNTFLLLLVSISVKSVISDGLVPVFVWGDVANAKLNTNALSTLNQLQFIEVLQKEVQDEVVIIFEEETLSVEDFSRRDSSGGTPYPYFQSMISESVYLPSVNSPLKTLNLVADNDQHLKLTDKGLSGKLDLNPGTYIFVSLKDARPDESRFQMLRRHNDFIQQTIADAKKKNNRVVGIYTAHFPSWTNEEYHTRVRRAVTPRNYIVYNTPNVLLYVKNMTFYAPNISEPLVDGIITSNKTDSGSIVATIQFPNTVALKLFFRIEGGYWVLPTIEITHPRHVVSENNTMLLYNSEVYALKNFSFRCGPIIKFKSPYTPQQVTRQYSVSFQDMQLQVYDMEKLNDTFGDPFNCVGFTSVPIWAGLMIVFIMLAITMYGFMMMMDIRTMDRFDDPKGKTISINAAE